MPRTRKPIKVKEPIRLRTKELANGSKSLYLDIYRNGKRTYEYLKMYLIPETDRNARQQNETTMAAANAIKSKRIIELTSGEAGIMNHKDKVYLLDWMQLYKEEQKKRGKKNTGQIKSVTDILKEYAGERFTLNQVDLTFCHGYIDYMLTSYRPKGKPLSASTRNTYYQIFNGALNAAVRAKRILKNPFNEMEKSEKPKMPESVRSYMTIEEVRSLIATPMQNEGVKSAYLFSCFCGLRISDIYKYSYMLEIENYGSVKMIIGRDYETFSGLMLERYFKRVLIGHHNDDFNPITGTCTMVLVRTEGRHKYESHTGAVKQFQDLMGHKYDTRAAVVESQSQGWLMGRKPSEKKNSYQKTS
ncbi:phage integrase SAM-like domain-containing protein [Odoribacter splanchnicus]|uniref:phage integrase SAM-like domain-containing protein n=1 Tax=Odoribacter splanchnicus TaxID=28118 RepID=UPI0034A4C5A2